MEFSESENICSKLVNSMMETMIREIEKVPKLIEAIETETNKMKECENYMYLKDSIIEEIKSEYEKETSDIVRMEERLKEVCKNCEEMRNKRKDELIYFEQILNGSIRSGFEAKNSRIQQKSFEQYEKEKNERLRQRSDLSQVSRSEVNKEDKKRKKEICSNMNTQSEYLELDMERLK